MLASALHCATAAVLASVLAAAAAGGWGQRSRSNPCADRIPAPSAVLPLAEKGDRQASPRSSPKRMIVVEICSRPTATTLVRVPLASVGALAR